VALYVVSDLHLGESSLVSMFRDEDQGRRLAELCAHVAAEPDSELVLLGDIAGGNAPENAAIIRSVLSGKKSAHRDVVLLNSAAALVAADKSDHLADAILVAADSIGRQDVPTVDEAGVPGFQSGSWQGLLATGATPKDVIAKLNTAVVQVLNSPEIKERMAAQGADVVGDTPEQFGAFIRDEKVRWAKIVKDAGIKGE